MHHSIHITVFVMLRKLRVLICFLNFNYLHDSLSMSHDPLTWLWFVLCMCFTCVFLFFCDLFLSVRNLASYNSDFNFFLNLIKNWLLAYTVEVLYPLFSAWVLIESFSCPDLGMVSCYFLSLPVLVRTVLLSVSFCHSLFVLLSLFTLSAE